MNHKAHRVIATLAVVCLLAASSTASITINYTGTGAAAGLNATATYTLNGGNQLMVTVTNTSTAPPTGSNMVLSSINFNTGTQITSGSATLNSNLPSLVVSNTGGAWTASGFAGDLNDEYGYSNTGVGNSNGGAILSGVTANQVNSLLNSAVTSHSNGGQAVTTFNGVQGGVGGGLDFGLVALGSAGFGNNDFVLNSMDIILNLSSTLADLSFLRQGSYVEFGSDYAYVGPGPGPGPVPEPASFLVWFGLAVVVGGGSWWTRRKSNQS